MCSPERLFHILLLFSFTFTAASGQQSLPGKLIRSVDPVFDFCFTPTGKTLAAAINESVNLFRTSDGSLLKTYNNGHHKSILCLDISIDTSFIVTGSKDSAVIVRSFDTGDIVRKYKAHDGPVTCVRFSSAGSYLYSSGTDGTVCLFSIESGTMVFRTKLTEGIITSFDISPDGKLIAAVDSKGKTILCNSMTGEDITVLKTKMGWLRAVSFSNDCKMILAAGDRGVVTRWQLRDGNFIIRDSKKISGNWIYGVDIHNDNNTYATCGFDKSVRVNINGDLYKQEIGSRIFKIRFIPGNDELISIAAATEKGIVTVNAQDMTY
jgi:WD40 repeat protein